MPWSKELKDAYNKAYHEKNREHLLDVKRSWYAENRERILAQKAAEYKADPQRFRDEATKKRREMTPEQRRRRDKASDLKKLYGMSIDDYEKLEAAQRGLCAICGERCVTGRRLAVDHCHETGAVRGLLCGRCNQAIGLLRHDQDIVYKAMMYLNG